MVDFLTEMDFDPSKIEKLKNRELIWGYWLSSWPFSVVELQWCTQHPMKCLFCLSSRRSQRLCFCYSCGCHLNLPSSYSALKRTCEPSAINTRTSEASTNDIPQSWKFRSATLPALYPLLMLPVFNLPHSYDCGSDFRTLSIPRNSSAVLCLIFAHGD